MTGKCMSKWAPTPMPVAMASVSPTLSGIDSIPGKGIPESRL
jgi:hypothetical protein